MKPTARNIASDNAAGDPLPPQQPMAKQVDTAGSSIDSLKAKGADAQDQQIKSLVDVATGSKVDLTGILVDLKEQVGKARWCLDDPSSLVTSSEKDILNGAQSKIDEISNGLRRHLDNMETSNYEPTTQEANRLQQKLNELFEQLNPIFSKLCIEQITALENLPMSKETKQRSSVNGQSRDNTVILPQTVTFIAMLSNDLENLAEGHRDLPVVQVREYKDGKWDNLTNMTKQHDGTWTGILKLALESDCFQYRYVVQIGDFEHDEWLGGERDDFTRYLQKDDLSKDGTAFDGVILHRAMDRKEHEENMRKGALAMLPNLLEQIKAKKTIEDLTDQIEVAFKRQLHVFTSFSHFQDCRDHYTKDLAETFRNEVFKGFISSIIVDHEKYTSSDDANATTICLSLIATLELAVRHNFTQKKLKRVAEVIRQSMEKIGEKDPACLSSKLIPMLSLDEKYVRMLAERMTTQLCHTLREDVHFTNTWITLLPIIHTLTGQMETKPLNDANFQWRESWVITPEISDLLKSARGQWEVWHRWLEPFFHSMPLLRYTFIFTLKESQLLDMMGSEKVKMLPVNGIVAASADIVKRRKIENLQKNHNLAKTLLSFLRKQLSENSIKCDEMTLKMLTETLDAKQLTHLHDITLTPSQNCGIFDFISAYLTVMDAMNKSGREQNPRAHEQTLKGICVEVNRIINKQFVVERSKSTAGKLGNDEMKLWTKLFCCAKKCTNQALVKLWRTVSQETLRARLKLACDTNRQLLIRLYCENKTADEGMDEVIEEHALALADEIIKMDFPHGNRTKVIKLVHRAVTKHFKTETGSQLVIVRKILEWNNFPYLWTFIDEVDREQKSAIAEESKKKMTIAVDALESVFKSIMDRTICFADFNVLRNQQGRLLQLCSITKHFCNMELLKQGFEHRLNEKILYHQFCVDINEFLGYCQPCVTGTDRLAKWTRVTDEKLIFADVLDVDCEHEPSVRCSALPNTVREILVDFKTHKGRCLFYQLFSSELKYRKGLDLEQSADVYKTAVKRYSGYVNQYETGSITIKELQTHLRKFFECDVAKLTKELSFMISPSLLDQRTTQIKLCAELEKCQTGATAILRFQKEFGLNGDFSALDAICESTQNSPQLKEITPELTKCATKLQDITEEQIDCLQAVLDSKDLVDWAHEFIKEDEISIFVELAGCAFGEGDVDAQKESSLLNALTGYSPLIHLDRNCDFSKFLERCTQIWKSLKTNKTLPQDLRNSALNLDLLRNVKDDSQMNSIERAKAINETGIYKVGHDHCHGPFKEVEDVITLTCLEEVRKIRSGKSKEPESPEKKKQDGKRVPERKYVSYTFSKLKDLQRKLTLVSGEKQGQNQESIQRFNAMKDAIENLANAYLAIRREGCLQFDRIFVMVYCNSVRTVGLELRLQPIERVISCNNEEPFGALEHCEALYTFFNDCVVRWQSIMNKNRRESPVLDYFTTEQLIVLRNELGTFHDLKSADCLQKSLPILAMIQPVDPGTLHQHIISYKSDSELKMESEGSVACGQFSSFEDLNQEQRDMVDELMDDLDDERLNESLALKLVNQLGFNAELGSCRDWIGRNASARTEESEDMLHSDVEVMQQVMESEPLDSPLLKQLGTLWTGFIEKTEKSLRNLLSISHLVHVLTNLQEIKTKDSTQRKIPTWLNRGRPQVLAVKEAITYQLVMSIYEWDRQCGSPTRNDVLICSTKTRCEEVQLFLNRALADSKSYYCLVNCHLLEQEVYKLIESRLSNTADDKVKDYGLALILTDVQKEARFCVRFSKCFVKDYVLATLQQLRDYVKELLVLPQSSITVDPDRCRARLITSKRAGVGKSLQKKNLCKELELRRDEASTDLTIPIYRTIDTDSFISRLNDQRDNGLIDNCLNTIHIDIAHEVESGVDELLFNLIILRSLISSEGVVWQAQPTQYYIIECTPLMREDKTCCHEVLYLFPTISCITPTEALENYSTNSGGNTVGFDRNQLHSKEWQIVLKYLAQEEASDKLYQMKDEAFADAKHALSLVIRFSGLTDPTWSELRHYVHFLSYQLFKVDSSPYSRNDPNMNKYLPGFRKFVVKFMFTMAQDFATRSLRIAEETPGMSISELSDGSDANLLRQLAMKRTWEDKNYPYLLFNEDGATYTPFGFYAARVDGSSYSLIDCESKDVLVRDCISRTLKSALDRNGMLLSENFNQMERRVQLCKLRDVMVTHIFLGASETTTDSSTQSLSQRMFSEDDDPDPDYVLTMDNVKKMLAIHQRLRVNIPVVIMGETGCGKTKLIEFMSKLQVPTALKTQITSMIVLKIHGGTTEEDIIKKVLEAQDQAKKNGHICKEYALRYDPTTTQVPKVYTVLFLDEANTTEAIGLIKEILCDHRMRGEPLDITSDLKIIAACNPYRKHSETMIKKLQTAGLGYSVGETDTKDCFGKIPMRQLVYRVQPLPQSLLPLVWDFGNLKSGEGGGTNVEKDYIEKMVKKFNKSNRNSGLNFENGHQTRLVTEILSQSQCFMKERKDECSFVSLRDVQRTLDVANWFYSWRDLLFQEMDKLFSDSNPDTANDIDQVVLQYDYSTRSLILALGVCYLARLEDPTREKYVNFLAPNVVSLLGEPDVDGSQFFLDQVERCQDMFISCVADDKRHKNIAKNKALKENVFMMIVCVENRIPLFLVGKPGSSKSLSKAMVVDAMKGKRSRSSVLKHMKEAYMVSFQCSKQTTPSNIVGIFGHCAQMQRGRDLEAFVTVVVLDEVGLAEDSELMPLKALHPLLEDGCAGDVESAPYMKSAFVGISNWALDPAKMNRGIFVQRGTPDPEELKEIAREICKKSKERTVEFIEPLANAYRRICGAEKPIERDRKEFFGLRDFYSLMKMVTDFASEGPLNQNHIEHSIRRNFGGFVPDKFDPMNIFREEFPSHCALDSEKDGKPPVDPEKDGKPPVDPIGVIKSALSEIDSKVSGGRYLLILAESLGVLSIILNEFASHARQPEVVFGSRFRDDISYSQICHNIYRIKTCMSMGTPVILLNLDDLYESLYDALNQYFLKLGNKNYVDIGLETHREKAFVHDEFRLVVIAEKTKVHATFPIPLISRLEKHYVSATTFLEPSHQDIKKELETWATLFVTPLTTFRKPCPNFCDGCGAELAEPYHLPCAHYIGQCCRDRIFHANIQSCPVEGCAEILSENFPWTLDKAALESRQYIENCTPGTVFIGYSSEATALAVQQALDPSSADSNEQILERAKFNLLQCATGEAVLRLDKTRLFEVSSALQKMHLQDQHHESLLQYLSHELGTNERKTPLIQVTTFAELMDKQGVEMLNDTLKAHKTVISTKCIMLKDFVREHVFTQKLRTLYGLEKQKVELKLLIVQSESHHGNTELLDSVRYIIQRESEEASCQTYTVLLLSVSRGQEFTGYQGGKWRCVHIDDPTPSAMRLPCLKECLDSKPSSILRHLVKSTVPEEIEDEGPPPLEGEDKENECPDYEQVPLPNSGNTELEKGLHSFLIDSLPSAVSAVHADNQERRLQLVKQLFDDRNGDLCQMFLTHACTLLNSQENLNPQYNWVKADAVKASNMKESETLRHGLENSLQRVLVPALAAVIQFIDVNGNLQLTESDSPLKELWMKIFCQSSRLGLSCDLLRKEGSSLLPKSYKIPEVGKGPATFAITCPFSWLAKDAIDKLMLASLKTGSGLDAEMLLRHFVQTPIGDIVSKVEDAVYEKMLEAYIEDFVYMTHPCTDKDEHWIIVSCMRRIISSEFSGVGKVKFVHVHLAFDRYKDAFERFTKVTSLFSSPEEVKKEVRKVIGERMGTAEQMKPAFLPLDLVALDCLLQQLAEVRSTEVRSNPENWVHRVETSKLIAPEIFHHYEAIDKSDELVSKCKEKWKLLEVKKLYVLHVLIPSPVIPDQDNSGKGKRSPLQLSFLMNAVKKTDLDFHKWDSFNQVVKSLEKSVSDQIRKLYDKCPEKCPGCKKSLDSPVRLVCGHLMCDYCTEDRGLCGTQSCGKETEVSSDPPRFNDLGKDRVVEFKRFRKTLNHFFMGFISDMVFNETQAPEEQIIQWLLNCATFGSNDVTRQFSLYNSADVIDDTPVLRSFLLKLLLKCSRSDYVIANLNRILNEWTTDRDYPIQTMALFMDCWKDLYEQNSEPERSSLAMKLSDATDQILVRGDTANLEALTRLTMAQAVVSQVVSIVLKPGDINSQVLQTIETSLNDMINRTRRAGKRQPGYFIARHVLAVKGESYLRDQMDTCRDYFIPDEAKQDVESFNVPDVLRYHGGQLYEVLTTALDDVLTQGASEDGFSNAVNQLKEVCAGHADLLLQVIFTRITLRQHNSILHSIRMMLLEKLQSLLLPDQSMLLERLLQNGGLPTEMDVQQSRGINFAMLVLTMYSCMYGAGAKGDLNPLAVIVSHPADVANLLLPTMADNQYEANRDVIRKALKGDEAPTAYTCANGHPYIVGNCGQLNASSVCNECGAPIGRGAAGTKKLEDRDAKSKRGHILGAAASRFTASPERELSVLSCCVLRLLTHLAMYTASLFNRNQLMSAIDPPLAQPDDVGPFLAAHIDMDIQQISKCCSLSADDCILLVHQVIHAMKVSQENSSNVVLSDIRERLLWEQKFDENYIKPVFRGDMVATVAHMKGNLRTVDSVDMKKLLSAEGSSVNQSDIFDSPGLWTFRRPLTLLALQTRLQSVSQDVPNLTKLINQCRKLMAVTYLPDILQLLKLLANKFSGKMSRREAVDTSIEQLCNKHSMPRLTDLVNSFIAAWEIYKTHIGGVVVQAALTLHSPVAMFLFDPHGDRIRVVSTHGASNQRDQQSTVYGISTGSHQLVHFIVEAHNSMIPADPERQSTPLSAVNSFNILGVSSEDEILTLVTSHNEYEVGDESNARYNWEALEQHVLHQYIGNKSMINFSEEQLPSFVYQEDFNLHSQLQAIDDTQTLLRDELKESLVRLLPRSVPLLKDFLKQLEVCINFLSAMSHIEGDNSLLEYMSTTFGIEPTYLSKEIKLRHIKHVWLTVKYMQTDQLMKQSQEPFGDVDPKFNAGLDETLKTQLDACGSTASVTTKLLLEELFKCIVLRLNKAAAVQAPESADVMLQDVLTEPIQFSSNDGGDDRVILQELPRLPDNLLVKHAAKAWCQIWRRYSKP